MTRNRPVSITVYPHVMGYMGFGMRKESYTRAPRKHMAYLSPFLRGVTHRRRPNPKGLLEKETAPKGKNQRSLPPVLINLIAYSVALIIGVAVVYATVRWMSEILDPKHPSPF